MNENGWAALHVFYAANANPMITETIGPLVDELREEGLIDGWFFIRYWMEGPHVRLRLRPRPGAEQIVLDRARGAIEAFLGRRPALYEEDRDGSDDLYKNMFLAEYGEDEWNALYGADGTMPFRQNNTVAEFDYDREFDRYGGADAVLVAEKHFEFSSDEIVRTLRTTAVHLRTIILGQATQQTLALCFALLETPEAVRRFLVGYRHMWETSYQEPTDGQHEGFDRSYSAMRDRLVERTRHVSVAFSSPAHATPTEARWLSHGSELRATILDLHAEDRLRFRDGATLDADAAVQVLLGSYVHMSNNRLGVSILDEIYIAYVLVKALDDAFELTPAL